MERKSSSEIDGHLFPSPDVNDWPDEGVLLEIGTLLGRSAVVWAEAFEQTGKNYKIVTLDSCEVEEFLHGFKRISGKQKEKKIKENIAGWDNISFRKVIWDKQFKFNEELTGVYYDAKHDYETTMAALEKYADFRWLYVDDCNDHYPGCQQACSEHAEKYNKKLEIKTNSYGQDQLAILTK